LDDNFHFLRTTCSDRAALKVRCLAFREVRCKWEKGLLSDVCSTLRRFGAVTELSIIIITIAINIMMITVITLTTKSTSQPESSSLSHRCRLHFIITITVSAIVTVAIMIVIIDIFVVKSWPGMSRNCQHQPLHRPQRDGCHDCHEHRNDQQSTCSIVTTINMYAINPFPPGFDMLAKLWGRPQPLACAAALAAGFQNLFCI
jgi:hypothetical protein